MKTQFSISKAQVGNAGKRSTKQAPRLVRVQTRMEFASLEDDWDELIAQSQTPSPFLTWDYLDTWWSIYGQLGYDVKLYIARDDEGQLVGAVPLMITQRGAFPGARGKFRHLAFMGGAGEMLGESLEIPTLPGYEKMIGKAAAGLILGSLKSQWEVLYFYLVPKNSVATHVMLDDLAKEGMSVQKTHSLDSPCVNCAGQTWDEHLQKKSSKSRSALRRREKAAKNKHGMRILEAGRDMPLQKAVDHLVRLTEKRWGDNAKAFHTPEFIVFHRKLASRFIKKGRLYCKLVELDGKIAGAAYDFIYADKVWGYQAPWDLEFRKMGTGNLINSMCFKNAFDLGLREFDMLPGDSNYKDEWVDHSHTLNIYEAAHPNSLGGTLFTVARKFDKIIKG